jgi:hypothetical protein
MTAPDTDVRLWCRPTPAGAGGAGGFALARLLLRFLVQLRQLDRRLLLLFAISLLPACIIPAGPEFQDPPGVPNAPPQILDPNPTWGAEVAGTQSEPFTFQMYVTDVNVSDDLFIRWIVDDVPVASGKPIVPHTGSGPLREFVDKRVTCQDPFDHTKSRHLVRGVVADRDYDDSTQDLLKVQPPGLYNLVTWTLNMTCPVSPMSPQ